MPNLRELLESADKRSRTFYRGYDVCDPANVSFVSGGDEAERVGWKVDTAVRGDGNQGHKYGAALNPAEKDALLEYLNSL